MPVIQGMRSEDLLRRLHVQAVEVLALVGSVHHRVESQSTFEQICRCAPSARDNYRSACRGRSRKEFVSKLGVALDEADETVGWLEVMRDAHLAPSERITPLLREAIELRAILATSYKTSRTNLRLFEEKRKREQRKRRPNQ
ncbi:MAG: four helix bundle protein [Vicinamibacterales bacterium]